MKKIFLIALLTLLLLGAAALIWSFSGYLLSFKDTSTAKIPAEVTLPPAKDHLVGGLITVSTEFTLPRYRKVLNVRLTPGSGTVTAMPAEARKVRTSWRTAQWKVEGKLCPLRPGTSQSGVLALELSPIKGSSAKTAFTCAIPALQIKELPAVATPDVELASALTPEKKISKRWHFLWLLLLLLLPLLFLLRKKAPKAAKLSLRSKTLGALENLRTEVVARTLTAEQGITRLSDVIRTYLEQRYALPVSGKTTPEFLEEMESNSPLPESDKPFLQNFLNSADMIKFAKAPCDAPAVSAAIDSAEKLVLNTALPEEEKNA